METFSFNPPVYLSQEGKWLSAVTSFKATNSVFNITDGNNSFSFTTPGHWFSRGDAETNYRLQRLVKLRYENDFKLHVENFRERGNQMKRGDKKYELSNLDTRKNEIIPELKNVESNDLDDLIFRMDITYHEIAEILDKKYIDASTIGYNLEPGFYEDSDNILMLKSLLSNEVKVSITIDDIRLKSNSTTNRTTRHTKKPFFYTILGFTQSQSGPW